MKKKLTITDLKTIELNATILRACNTIPFMLANKINGLAIAVLPGINKFKDKIDLINERQEQLSTLQGDDLEKAKKKLKEDVAIINKEKYEVEITPIPLKDFEGIEINGEKETMQAGGEKVLFNYRDAYFDLHKAQMIA
jgi:hypothetical protein